MKRHVMTASNSSHSAGKNLFKVNIAHIITVCDYKEPEQNSIFTFNNFHKHFLEKAPIV